MGHKRQSFAEKRKRHVHPTGLEDMNLTCLPSESKRVQLLALSRVRLHERDELFWMRVRR